MITNTIKIAALMILITLSGCNYRPLVGSHMTQELFQQGPENATNKFKHGWRHGCETGISVTANNFQKTFYQFKQDHKLAQNREYYAGWKTAYDYCQRYVAQYLRRRIF